MKKIHALLLGSTLALSGLATVQAGDMGGHDGERQGHHNKAHKKGHRGDAKRLHKMLEKVGATEEQKQVIAAIIEAEKPTMEALKTRKKALREQVRLLDPMSGDYNSRVQTLAAEKADIAGDSFVHKAEMKQKIALQLTPEQRATLAEFKAERAARRAEMQSMTKEERQQLRAERKANRAEKRGSLVH